MNVLYSVLMMIMENFCNSITLTLNNYVVVISHYVLINRLHYIETKCTKVCSLLMISINNLLQLHYS